MNAWGTNRNRTTPNIDVDSLRNNSPVYSNIGPVSMKRIINTAGLFVSGSTIQQWCALLNITVFITL